METASICRHMKMKLILLIEQVFFVCSVLTKKKKERRMDGGQLESGSTENYHGGNEGS